MDAIRYYTVHLLRKIPCRRSRAVRPEVPLWYNVVSAVKDEERKSNGA